MGGGRVTATATATDTEPATSADVGRLDGRLTTVENGLKGLRVYVQQRFADMDARFDAMDQKLDAMDQKLDDKLLALEEKLDQLLDRDG